MIQIKKHIIYTNLSNTLLLDVLALFVVSWLATNAVTFSSSSPLEDTRILQSKQYPTDFPAIQPLHSSFSSNLEHRLHTDVEHCMQTYFVTSPQVMQNDCSLGSFKLSERTCDEVLVEAAIFPLHISHKSAGILATYDHVISSQLSITLHDVSHFTSFQTFSREPRPSRIKFDTCKMRRLKPRRTLLALSDTIGRI
jgi:hypothetical protein